MSPRVEGARAHHHYETIVTLPAQFTVAREYYFTLYIRWQFIRFSCAVLYRGVPAFFVAPYTIQTISLSALPGMTLGVRNLLLFERATLTVTIPFSFFVPVSYIA